MKIIGPSVKLRWITPDALGEIERAGRVCYKSEGKIKDGSAESFVKKLIERGHEAMIEHAVASLLFICDRGVTHEIVRHRPPSYAQESTRYCNYSSGQFGNEITVVKPLGLEGVGYDSWLAACKATEQSYMAMVGAGISPQIARSVLPNSLKTEIVVTTNFREWRHILKLRTSKFAHPQMREVMLMAFEILVNEVPVVFDDLRIDG